VRRQIEEESRAKIELAQCVSLPKRLQYNRITQFQIQSPFKLVPFFLFIQTSIRTRKEKNGGGNEAKVGPSTTTN
jgi:hypothetical protein